MLQVYTSLNSIIDHHEKINPLDKSVWDIPGLDTGSQIINNWGAIQQFTQRESEEKEDKMNSVER